MENYFANKPSTPVQSNSSINSQNPMASLVDGINSLPPLTRAEVEAHYAQQKPSDAYGDSFVASNKPNVANVEFDDPMTRAYALITDDSYARAAGNVEPEESEKKRVTEPTLDRTVSGTVAMADFAFPVTTIGKRGIPKENPLQVDTLERNLISLQARNQDQHQTSQVQFDEGAKKSEVEKKKKPKKSRLGPILNPDDIGVERQVKIAPGETKTIVVDDKTREEQEENQMEKPRENEPSESKPKPIETGAESNLTEKLESLKKASGQEAIDQVNNHVDIELTEVPIETKKKRKRSDKEKEKTFTLGEKTLKDDDDGKIIAVEVPESIKNFGKSK